MADLADAFRSDYMSHTCKIISLCSTSFDLRVSMFFKTQVEEQRQSRSWRSEVKAFL